MRLAAARALPSSIETALLSSRSLLLAMRTFTTASVVFLQYNSLVDFSYPGTDVVEGLTVCDVVHNRNCLGTAVVVAGHASEACIPLLRSCPAVSHNCTLTVLSPTVTVLLFCLSPTHSTPIVLINRFVKELSCLHLTVNLIIRQVFPTPEFPIVSILSTESLPLSYYLFGPGLDHESCSPILPRY